MPRIPEDALLRARKPMARRRRAWSDRGVTAPYPRRPTLSGRQMQGHRERDAAARDRRLHPADPGAPRGGARRNGFLVRSRRVPVNRRHHIPVSQPHAEATDAEEPNTRGPSLRVRDACPVNGAQLVRRERGQPIDGDDQASGARHLPSGHCGGRCSRTPRDRALAGDRHRRSVRLRGGRWAGWWRLPDGARALDARCRLACHRVTKTGHQKALCTRDEREGRKTEHDDKGGRSTEQRDTPSIAR